MEKIREVFSKMTKDEQVIFLVVASIFLPFYITAIVLIAALIYLAAQKKLVPAIKQVPQSKFAIGFCILAMVVSLLYQNYVGLLCSIGMLLLLFFVFFFRTVITKPFFEFLLNTCCVMSCVCVVFGFLEYVEIAQRMDFPVWSFQVNSRPDDRVHVGFFNANYYAMMLEFIILICIYKITNTHVFKHALIYVGIILGNMLMLYLTGCRTAWIPFLLTVPLMFFMTRRYGYLALAFGAMGAGGLTLFCFPSLFQRMMIVEDFFKRTKIWVVALKGIKAHPLFGEGPLTYMHIYEAYHGHPTQHAHNVFLDPLLSHGLVGVIIFGVYIVSNVKEVIRLYTRNLDIRLCALITGFILTVLIHGLLDYTIFWIQTGLLFLLILSSSSIYFNKDYKPVI